MFFIDGNGILSCQLGSGDVAVSEATFKNLSPRKAVAVVFWECIKGKIGRTICGVKGMTDHEAKTRIKLIFTNSKSIDVVIGELKQAKKLMKEK